MLIQDFVLEYDSQILINALKDEAPPPTVVAALVYGSLFASYKFRKVVFSHIGRQGNRPAHLLAKHALRIVDFSIWIEETPYFLEQALLYDVIVSLSS